MGIQAHTWPGEAASYDPGDSRRVGGYARRRQGRSPVSLRLTIQMIHGRRPVSRRQCLDSAIRPPADARDLGRSDRRGTLPGLMAWFLLVLRGQGGHEQVLVSLFPCWGGFCAPDGVQDGQVVCVGVLCGCGSHVVVCLGGEAVVASAGSRRR
jgi:hypothetical protein